MGIKNGKKRTEEMQRKKGKKSIVMIGYKNDLMIYLIYMK